MKKRQLTGPESATSRPIADTLGRRLLALVQLAAVFSFPSSPCHVQFSSLSFIYHGTQTIFMNHSNKNLVFIISWCGNFKGGSGQSTPTLVLKRGMDQWMLAATLAQLLKDRLQVWRLLALVRLSAVSFIPFSLPCVVLQPVFHLPWYADHLH